MLGHGDNNVLYKKLGCFNSTNLLMHPLTHTLQMNIIAINYGTYIYPSAVSIIYVESAFPNFLYEYIRDIETMLDNNLEYESRFYELTF